jgi:hypothetical protein
MVSDDEADRVVPERVRAGTRVGGVASEGRSLAFRSPAKLSGYKTGYRTGYNKEYRNGYTTGYVVL